MNWQLLIFAVAALTSFTLGRWGRQLALRADFLDKPRGDRSGDRTVPLGGGLSWYLALLLLVILGWLTFRAGHLPDFLRIHDSGLRERLGSLLWILGGGLVLMQLGWRDDIKPVKAPVKLLVQLLVAMLVTWRVPEIRSSHFGDVYPWVSVLTVLWIVFWTNAFNFLDHADGVATVTGVAVLLGLAVLAAYTGQLFVGIFALAVAGVLAGFLPHNLPPAGVYMGDAGSLPLGYLIAVLCAIFSFYRGEGISIVVFTPFCLLAAPLYDTCSVMIIRWREGRPVWLGDRSHLAHRLISRGFSPPQALGMIFLLTFVGALSAYLTMALPTLWRPVPAIVMVLGLILLGRAEARSPQ